MAKGDSVGAGDGRLPAQLAGQLEPELQDALDHPIRREILRVLNGGRGSCGLTELGAELRSFGIAQLQYHLQVLQRLGVVASEAGIGTNRGRVRYASEVGDDKRVRAVLRATEGEDRKRMELVAAAGVSPLLTMLRVPRPVRTIRLCRRREIDAGR